ncbi:hypothetical protein RclHR1_00020001 [Rhizophagus clarus]|uniref:Protein kinase domain-containing protein n=1 Tax=Rhizophagus clarus TaxID=94130 RepID=A0A2Z6RII4_9GLOM|nr:hypothetical protein RclHR1_00020001 [Rhizophagus clarus]
MKFLCENCGLAHINIQDNWCIPCQLRLEVSGIEKIKIDNYIRNRQKTGENPMFEWIPYNQLIDIEEIENYGSTTIYLAKWRNGPLYWDETNRECTRKTDVKVILKYLHDVQYNIDQFLNEVNKDYLNMYGISQNPNTNDYLMIFNNKYFMKYCVLCGEIYSNLNNMLCDPCLVEELESDFINWSGNEKIDNLIQERLSECIFGPVFEWIPYNQFNEIKEINNNDHAIIYSARWKDGPLYLDVDDKEYGRIPDTKVVLKYLHDSQNNTDPFLNKIKQYMSNFDEINDGDTYGALYGISQNQDTKNYFMIFADGYLEYIVQFVVTICIMLHGEKQLESPFGPVFEWISYNQFDKVKAMNKSNLATICSAKWRDGPLYWDGPNEKYSKKLNTEVVLKRLYNSQNDVDQFLNEVKKYQDDDYHFKLVLYGISQEPYANDYLIIFHINYFNSHCMLCDKKYSEIYKWCKLCQIENLKENLPYSSRNKKIDGIIQEMQLNINSSEDIIFEWIPFSQFNDIKEINKSMCSAIWKDGPLYWNEFPNKKYIRKPFKKVALKYLHNNIDEFPNEIKQYTINRVSTSGIIIIYGISQVQNANKYLLVLNDNYFYAYCEICDEKYSKYYSEWSKWKNGPLIYDRHDGKYVRQHPNKTVALKCLHASTQNVINKFLNEVKEYSVNCYDNNILSIYGISQIPDTGEYICVLEYATGGNLNNWVNNNYKIFTWSIKTRILFNISRGLKNIHRKRIVHRDLHTGNILLFANSINFDSYYNILSISDMGLCGEIDNIDETNIYGVMPYIAPEVLKGKPYTQAADIFSFGMIMYFVATGKQPFIHCAHDELLVLDICKGIRPKINEPEAPKHYINLMEKCWDSNPENRPNSNEVFEIVTHFWKLTDTFTSSYINKDVSKVEIDIIKQFNEAEKYRRANVLSVENNQLATHKQAVYMSRLLNSFTKNLSKYDDKTECLDCQINMQ